MRSEGASSAALRPEREQRVKVLLPLPLVGAYDYAGASSRLGFDSHSLFGALAGPLSKKVILTGYGTVGMSRGAPDHGIGLLVTFRTR